MSGPLGSSQWMYSTGGGAFYPHEIGQSLRFNDNDSAYLSRTPASAGNQRKLTWSAWVKRSAISNAQSPLLNATPGGAGFLLFFFNDALFVYNAVGGTDYGYVTTDVFRDSAAWYHVLLKVDTAQATAADRVVLYVNNRRLTSIATSYDDFPQNYDLWLNSAQPHYIGRRVDSGLYFDGYMAEIIFVDGQALDPTDFGELKSGVWVPKEYTGTYGTNGYYLPFSDSAAIGDDLSGNANDWTANNLVSTDVLLDSPTNNWCVLNRVSPLGATLNQGNLGYTTGTGTQPHIGSFVIPDSGKWYWEVYVSAVGEAMIGVQSTENLAYAAEKTVYYRSGGASNGIYIEGSTVATAPASYTNGDIISVLLDCDGSTIDWYKNGVSQTSGESLTYVNGLVPILIQASGSGSNSGVINFGQDSSFAGAVTRQGNTDANGRGDFYYAPPSGFLALCTANLPAPAIDPAVDDVPADYFNTVLYTGTGAAQSITGVGFQPDWVWIKDRGVSQNHNLYDAVRGTGNMLATNLINAEFTGGDVAAFATDGFDLSAAVYQANISGRSYVAWNWLAGNGTSSNTDGTITSTVSVNQKAGFSIVGWTGNGIAGATVGHGLGVAPSVIIVKDRDAAKNWNTYHKSIGATNTILLNFDNASTANDNFYNTAPTNAVWANHAGDPAFGSQQNINGNDYISYCFAEVDGFSKFGSYTGNGSANGPFVYCGFRPAFIMVKRTNTTGNWTILDNSREGYNVDNDPLYPNLSNAEGTTDLADLLSNGFKLRSTDASVNASGGTYIFAAFAEQPFKFSNAR